MIKSVIVVSNQGKPRLARFYDGTVQEQQQLTINRLHSLVTRRQEDASCCFCVDYELFPEPHTVVYRHFATLYFIFVTDGQESELGILDLIQVFVQVLDACFENVCELDLIYHFDKVNFVLDEIIVGGLVMETSPENILNSVGAVKQLVDSEHSFFA